MAQLRLRLVRDRSPRLGWRLVRAVVVAVLAVVFFVLALSVVVISTT